MDAMDYPYMMFIKLAHTQIPSEIALFLTRERADERAEQIRKAVSDNKSYRNDARGMIEFTDDADRALSLDPERLASVVIESVEFRRKWALVTVREAAAMKSARQEADEALVSGE